MSEFSFMEGGHDAGGEHGMQTGHEGQGNASTTAAWNSSFRSVKLSDMLQGINITPNFMLAMLFLGFTSWLFVVYWIRHNEPLANQVLGTPTAGAPTSHADRRIVAGAKFALPIRNHGADFYTPCKKQRGEHNVTTPASTAVLPTIGDPSNFTQQSKEAFQSYGYSTAMTGGSAAYGAPMLSNNHSRLIKEGREHIVIHHPEPMQTQPVSYPTAGLPTQTQYHPAPLNGQIAQPHPSFGQPTHNPAENFSGYQGQHGSFRMHVGSAEGMKLRTVVNR